MANPVRILPEQLCNQIAAGEVVERPASVVKELVENSLDAGATEVVVTVERGGSSLIRVEDDGIGMNRDDLFLCLERHATSKIAEADDLFRLNSLGFRGEALPSIGAVSRLVLQSRTRDALEGLSLHVEGGTIKKTLAAGMPPGTSVEVRNLFFNLPARRKFLKTDATEFSHIADVLFRMALSFPGVRFVLRHNGQTVLNLSRCRELSPRVLELLGDHVFAELTPVQHISGELKLEGFIGSPGLHRATSGSLYTFVNRRFVRDRLIQHAVMGAFRHFLPRQRYPIAVIFLDLPSEQVDVNVHPAKREVRFRREREVHDFLSETLTGVLRKNSFSPASQAGTAVEDEGSLPPNSAPEWRAEPHRVSTAPEGANLRTAEAAFSYGAVFSVGGSGEEDCPAPPVGSQCPAVTGGGRFSSMRVLGQYHHSYLLCQEGDDLVILDQHAAHERIGYERLRAEFKNQGVEKQDLLFPLVLEVSFSEAAVLEQRLAELAQLGFDVEPYGNRSCALRSFPALLTSQQAESALRDVLEEISVIGAGDSIAEALEKVFIRMACHGMVRANQPLTSLEMKALLTALDHCDFNSHCPHGRPVLRRFALAEIEGMFQRT
ncbi:MAG: DNA mismatch repair endonuclease MutL [Deltaproteobacteria bacterium]|nr:DNA mismatch repair endonuclease MutL [Deltaproteobacteria bacterium]